MSERHWFQIHLSTAILLMCIAGGIIGQNLRKVRVVELLPSTPPNPPRRCYRETEGWPFTWHQSPTDDYEIYTNGAWGIVPHRPLDDSIHSTLNIFLNIAFLLFIIAFVYLVSERLICKGYTRTKSKATAS